MEDHEVRLIYLIYEMKRKIAVLLIAGLVGGILLCGYSYVKTKNEAASVQYGSKIVVQMKRSVQVEGLDESNTKAVNMTDINSELIKSDAVLGEVVNLVKNGYPDLTIQAVRGMIYTQGKSNGESMSVYTVTGNQEMSNAISKALEKGITDCINVSGLECTILQSSNDMGSVAVSINGDETANSYNVAAVEHANYVNRALKYLLIGFIVTFILAYIVICFKYIIKGKVCYLGELDDVGIKGISYVNIEKIENEPEVIAGWLAFFKQGPADVKVLSYFCENEIENLIEQVNNINENIKMNYVGEISCFDTLSKIKTDDDVVIAIKRDKVGLELLEKTKNYFDNANVTINGALVIE